MLIYILLALALGSFYATAKRRGKSGILWAIAGGLTFFGGQFALGLGWGLYRAWQQRPIEPHELNGMGLLGLGVGIVLTIGLHCILTFCYPVLKADSVPRYQRRRTAPAAGPAQTDPDNPYQA